MFKKLIPILLSFALLASCAMPSAERTSTTAVDASAVASSVEGDLTVHFIDVGQADAVLILSGEESMLIDGGNVADGDLVVAYLEGQGVQTLDYMVCTHAHEDHVGGLTDVLENFTVEVVYSPVTEYDSNAFRNFVTATENQGICLTAPVVGDSFPLGEAVITILGPVEDYTAANDTSIVLRLDYDEVAFLFTGDMELEAETDLVESGAELWATVLKVGHHGSSTSTSYAFLREVLPTYAIISCGTDNSYGHPHEEVTSRLFDAGTTVYRTDLLGNIVATSDGKEVTFATSIEGEPTPGRADATLEEAEQETLTYIGNVNSKVFHSVTCGNLPKEENQILFSSREDAVEAGFTPCGNCNP